MRLELVEPCLEHQHRFAPQAEDARAGIVGDALVVDEACLEQDPQMPAHDRSGCPDGGRQLAGPLRSVTENLDDPPPSWVAEHREDPVHVVCHRINS
jgi:hypothetical protein